MCFLALFCHLHSPFASHSGEIDSSVSTAMVCMFEPKGLYVESLILSVTIIRCEV